MPEAVQGVAFLGQSGFGEILQEYDPCRRIAQAVPTPGMEELLLVRVSLRQPGLQGLPGIIAERDHPADLGLLRNSRCPAGGSPRGDRENCSVG